jgi:HJR/Mrr/RecB family endonuclease
MGTNILICVVIRLEYVEKQLKHFMTTSEMSVTIVCSVHFLDPVVIFEILLLK